MQYFQLHDAKDTSEDICVVSDVRYMNSQTSMSLASKGLLLV